MSARAMWIVGLAGAAVLAAELPAHWKAAMAAPSAGSLRGHASFLASDLLEGRDTPSRGLDIAAEYIAAQFRRAGLEPGVGSSYYQESRWYVGEPDWRGFELTFEMASGAVAVPAGSAAVQMPEPVDARGMGVFLLELNDASAFDGVETLRGKAAVTVLGGGRGAAQAIARMAPRLRKLEAAVWILVDPRRSEVMRSRPYQADSRPAMPIVGVEGEAAQRLVNVDATATVTARSAAWTEREVTLRNVIGVAPGTDQVLRDSYVLLTAHYDHVGTRASGEDRIYNGANDDASGVAVLLEAAAALGAMRERPKRTVVFLAVFGEEKGLLGSRYYAKNPVFALEKTIGALNIELVGRTDAEDGPHDSRIAMTGHGYSTITETLAAAGEAAGFTVYRHDPNSDAFFTRSDNAAFAESGIPAHTLSTGFVYPDYHQPGDHWEKLNYAHMEKVARLVTVGALMLAESGEAPRWNSENPRTERFRKAAEALRGR
jgi:Zn-dependent M28 family amino/carboxypeptidase